MQQLRLIIVDICNKYLLTDNNATVAYLNVVITLILAVHTKLNVVCTVRHANFTHLRMELNELFYTKPLR